MSIASMVVAPGTTVRGYSASVLATARMRSASASAAECAPSLLTYGSGMRARITPMRLMSSEMPCQNRSTNPMRMSDFAGHCGNPPAFTDCSLSRNDLMKKGTRRTQEEYRPEQNPLQFQPRVRRGVEDFSYRGVGRRNDHHDQDQPGQDLADPKIDRVDGAAQLEQALHVRSP